VAGEGQMTLAQHLIELRRRILISLLAIAAGTAVAFAFHSMLLHVLAAPYCHTNAAHRLGAGNSCVLVVTGVLDGFSIAVKLSFYAGLLLSAPVWLWQIWRFLTPGLRRNERRLVVGFVGSALLMFTAGGALAYLTLGKGLQFLLSFAGDGITPLLTVNRYMSFLLAMILVFGLAFEFPVLLVLLNRVGILPSAKLRSWRRQAIFLVFLFAAVATPSQDPFTMVALAVPMCAFYEAAIAIARLHERRVRRRQALRDRDFWLQLDDDEASPLGSIA
jgi:sec-independent protein translocase protein TatC